MVVKTWDEYMIPHLNVLADGEVWKQDKLIEVAAEVAGVGVEEHELTIPSGQALYVNRADWALTYLKKAGAIVSPMRAHFQITPMGRDLLSRYPDRITEKQLRMELVGTETGVARNDEFIAGERMDRLHHNDPALSEQADLEGLEPAPAAHPAPPSAKYRGILGSDWLQGQSPIDLVRIERGA